MHRQNALGTDGAALPSPRAVAEDLRSVIAATRRERREIRTEIDIIDI